MKLQTINKFECEQIDDTYIDDKSECTYMNEKTKILPKENKCTVTQSVIRPVFRVGNRTNEQSRSLS